MRGLLVKDVKLVYGQKRFWVIVLAIALLFMAQGDVMLAAGYMVMMAGMLGITTFSYDEYNNGMAFLFTMPFSRRVYVLEKYLFTVGGVALLTAVCAAVGVLFARSGLLEMETAELLASLLGIGAVGVVFAALVFPFLFRYGAERGRLVGVAFGVACALLLHFLVRLQSPGEFYEKTAWLQALDGRGILLLLASVTASVLLLSVFFSILIMEKKEF